MDFKFRKASSRKAGKARSPAQTCTLIALNECKQLPLADLGAMLGETVARQCATLAHAQQFTGKAGSQILLSTTENGHAEHFALLGLGNDAGSALSASKQADAIARAAAALARQTRCASLVVQIDALGCLDTQAPVFLRTLATRLEHRFYRFTEFKTRQVPPEPCKHVEVLSMHAAQTRYQTAFREGLAIGQGMNSARTLGNLPGNICTPQHLAQKARKLAASHATIKTTVLGEAQMKKLGMGSFLAVAHGSEREGQLICMEYRGKTGKQSAPVILVGKGITFDTGGISLKPGASMDEMKFDMCGAASVFGVMEALAALRVPLHVVGIVAAAENMPSGRASRPGDIVHSMSGQTIEILNTDAEGRLVLCDALTYAARYKPRTIIDIATLTGACVVALGSHASAVYANDEALQKDLIEAGETSGDRAWPMPLWDEYQKQLDSAYADMANIGGPKAGSITAACFLSRFVKDIPWAHMDIAGTAWESAGPDKGASGRPVALLMQYLLGNKA